MSRTIPLTKARTNLGAIVKKIRLEKEYVVLEKDGFPIVGIMDIDEFEDYLDARNLEAAKEIASSQKDVRSGKVRPARDILGA